MRKRIISFILCMAMVFMFLPATAQAAEFSKQEFSLELNKKYSSYYLTFDDHNYEAYSVQMLDGTGVLPEGLDWFWNATGIYLAGTPTKSGEYSVAFKIVRGDDNSELIHRVFITVGEGETSSEEMTLYTIKEYSREWLTFDDHNSEAITVDISDGELPEGLNWYWNAEGIYLKGSPTEPGMYYATFRVVRGDDGSVVRHNVIINVEEPEISTETIFLFPNEKVRQFLKFDDHNYEARSVEQIDGVLPEGLDWYWNAEGIYVTGTPTEEGCFYPAFLVVRGDDDSVVLHAVTIIVSDGEYIFDDVNKGDWYFDSVIYNFKRGLMTGKTDTTFAPLENIARAQFAVILHRMEGKEPVEFTPVFPDVAEGVWYTDAVLWANGKKIVTGYTNTGTFGPADNITREQMAVMMYRYAQYKGYDVSKMADFSPFEDASSVSGYAQEAMSWAVGTGIITGKYEGTRLDPQGNALRAECAIIIQRFMDYEVLQ